MDHDSRGAAAAEAMSRARRASPPELANSRRGDQSRTYDQIKSAILDGTLKPEAPLIEVQVAKWCGVSRTPVREAIKRLEQEGLVERTVSGIVVRSRSPEEILDIYAVRIGLEALAARTAAERRTRLDLGRLEKMIAEAPPVAGEYVVAYNRQFHQFIWKASHNEALIDLLERLASQLARYPATTLTYPGRWREVLDSHKRLVAAIESSNADEAAAIATEQFTRARDIRLELYKHEII